MTPDTFDRMTERSFLFWMVVEGPKWLRYLYSEKSGTPADRIAAAVAIRDAIIRTAARFGVTLTSRYPEREGARP